MKKRTIYVALTVFSFVVLPDAAVATARKTRIMRK